MRVVELVSLAIGEPEPVAAERVPADGEDHALGDCEDRRAELGEDVVAVMPAGVGAEGTEAVAVRDLAVDGEDVRAGGQQDPLVMGDGLDRT